MFFQRDYVLRMIEMMGDLMRRIGELLDDLSRAKLLSEACRTHCGIDLESAEALTAESLETLLPPMPRLMMSEILYMRAKASSLPMDQQEELFYKSFHLLASLWSEGPLCELRTGRLLELKALLMDRISPEELLCCARFFQEAEAYDHMEDALFQAAEQLPPGAERDAALAEGTGMLAQAASAAPQALAFAHCTREELLDSVRDLQALA